MVFGLPIMNVALFERGDDAVITIEPTATRLIARRARDARVGDMWRRRLAIRRRCS